jgi:hypothetical protein
MYTITLPSLGVGVKLTDQQARRCRRAPGHALTALSISRWSSNRGDLIRKDSQVVGSECLDEGHPVARKEHRCYLCGLAIPVGAKHTKRTGVTDGEFWSARMHHACEALTKSWAECEWESFDPSDFRQYLEESKNEQLETK